MKRNVVVLAPHPDDEVLGVGGTIARLAREGSRVTVAILTKGMPPHFRESDIERGRREALRAHKVLGVRETVFLDLPAAELDTVPHRVINQALGGLFQRLKPDMVFLPFAADIHLDHQLAFLSALVASRPNHGNAPRTIFAYETLSETNWNAPYLAPAFQPNVYFDITRELPVKLKAMRTYASQVQKFPHERSLEALEALARLRGSTVGVAAAEGFVLIRDIR